MGQITAAAMISGSSVLSKRFNISVTSQKVSYDADICLYLCRTTASMTLNFPVPYEWCDISVPQSRKSLFSVGKALLEEKSFSTTSKVMMSGLSFCSKGTAALPLARQFQLRRSRYVHTNVRKTLYTSKESLCSSVQI